MKNLFAAWSVLLLVLFSRLIAQSELVELEEESASQAVVLSATIEHLLRSPLNLHGACVEELLGIPGLRRTEASAIVRAVERGEIAELRSVDFLPGVRPGTAARLAPFVTLDPPSRMHMTGWIRTVARLRHRASMSEVLRERVDLHLEQKASGANTAPAQLVVRRVSVPETEWTSYMRSPVLVADWTVHLGHMNISNGSALLDNGRRTSLFRPADWERRMTSEPQIRPGYNAAVAERGMALLGISERRSFLAAKAEQGRGRDANTVGWAESWMNNVRSYLVHETESHMSALRIEVQTRSTTISGESAIGRKLPSHVLFVASHLDGGSEIEWIVRSLRGLPAAGVPRAGGASDVEEASGLAIWFPATKQLRVHLSGDIGRMSPGNGTVREWTPLSSIGGGSEIRLVDRTTLGIEVRRQTKRGLTVHHQSFRAEQMLGGTWKIVFACARKTEWPSAGSADHGRMAMSSLAWKTGRHEALMVWLSGIADGNVEFWTVGPGSLILSTPQRFSGRFGQVRGYFQWEPLRRLSIGFSITCSYLPTNEVRSSILLDFQL